MNERIKQLAEQAWTMVSDEERARNELYEADAQRERRDQVFAELIVRECIQVSEPVLDEPYENMTEFGKGLVEGQDVAIEKIKQHFGVEE